MTQLFSGWILLAVFTFSAAFYQQFYLPKLIVFYAMAVSGVIFLASRRQLFLPGKPVLLFMGCYFLVASLLGVGSVAPLTAYLQWSYYLGGGLLFMVFLNFSRAQQETLLKVVFVSALAQLVVVVPQFLSLQGFMPVALMGRHDHVFGTIGNQEFLATWLGVGFFLGLYFRDGTQDRQQRTWLLAACVALALGLVVAQNKGALLFIGLSFLWRRFPRYKFLLALVSVTGFLAVAYVFPTSIMGRMFLWLVATVMFLQHFALGVGYLQFENHYLEVVHQLFSTYPALSQLFGGYTAQAMDTHNIFLQWGVELGTAGLLLALVWVGYGLRLVRAHGDYLGVALLFLLFKCLYTVMLASISGMLITLLLFAILVQKRGVYLGGKVRRVTWVAAPLAVLSLVAAMGLGLSDYYYQQGARALFMGRNPQAITSLDRARSINKENADASLALAQASYIKGDYVAMRAYIENALIYRKNKDTYKIAAGLFYYAKLYDDAFPLYQFLHVTFPQHLTSMTKLASLYMLRHEYDQAYAMAQAVLHADPRKQADSDDRNIKIARQIVADSYPLISVPVDPALRKAP